MMDRELSFEALGLYARLTIRGDDHDEYWYVVRLKPKHHPGNYQAITIFETRVEGPSDDAMMADGREQFAERLQTAFQQPPRRTHWVNDQGGPLPKIKRRRPKADVRPEKPDE